MRTKHWKAYEHAHSLQFSMGKYTGSRMPGATAYRPPRCSYESQVCYNEGKVKNLDIMKPTGIRNKFVIFLQWFERVAIKKRVIWENVHLCEFNLPSRKTRTPIERPICHLILISNYIAHREKSECQRLRKFTRPSFQIGAPATQILKSLVKLAFAANFPALRQ